MNRKRKSKSAFFNLRILLTVALCSLGALLAMSSFTQMAWRFAGENKQNEHMDRDGERLRDMPVPGGGPDDLNRLELEMNNRLTYPTGKFDPAWLRRAAEQDSRIARGIPFGAQKNKLKVKGKSSPLALDPNNFTALGPQPEHMTGCSGCFDYGTTEGRVNAIVVDPTTTTPGSIVAYVGTDGGGVWKTTNCCSASTSWTVLTDGPLISTTAIDTLAIDSNDHNTIYAGTGDLNYGSFSQGSQGILKSTDGGATWVVLAPDVFGAALPEPPGQFPQYQSVGKVRVDPNNSNNVIAGTKTGLYLSYDGGNNWTGPCTTNSFSTQRQDITGLELTNISGTTRILAAVGVRGFATTVQYNLDQNGANGLYKGTLPASGCPSDFTLITSNANGFVYSSTAVAGSPYGTNANMNAGSGTPYALPVGTGTQLGRLDIAVAPSNPNYIYVQVGQIAANPNGGCGNTSGCQLGVWASTDGGTSWSFMTGSAGQSLLNCTGGAGDYPQNWYDQGIAVDPNNPDRIFVDTFDVWFATRTGATFNDLTCGYSGGNVVHVDQHALAFVPGSSDILLKGSDGGVFSSSDASTASAAVDNTWVNMDTGINTIEFYSGDISGNFATAAAPQANGGAQDNGSISVTFSGSPTGPVQWQMGKGGDGFYARLDPVGTGSSLRFWQGNNSGSTNRCISNCTAPGAVWKTDRGGWYGVDTQSFVLPYDLFHGGIPGGDDCPPAGAAGGCGNLVVGSTRVWETINGNTASTTTNAVTWYVTNTPTTQNMTKSTLGNRSFINQVKYSPKYSSVAIVGTNDANVWIGFNLGTGVASQANWVNVTGGNNPLPNRPVLGISLDASVSAANVPVGYAAVGGFNANTPTTPGHVFQVTCASTCGSFTWLDKTGNLPDIPVDSVINNPNYPQQVYAGTDFGLYYTDDITVASPVWNRFQNGLPNTMIWDMQIDRGATTLSVWTRSRGAFVWPLPSGAVPVPVPTSIVSRKTHGAAGPFDIDLKAPAPGIECRTGGATGDHTVVVTFAAPVTVSGNGSSKAQVLSGSGQVGAGGTANGNAVAVSGNQVTVSLTNVANAQKLNITIYGVNDGTNVGNVVFPMNVLLGDTNSSGLTNSTDVSQTKANSGTVADTSTFRTDVNVNGLVNSSDVSLVKSVSGTGLPPKNN